MSIPISIYFETKTITLIVSDQTRSAYLVIVLDLSLEEVLEQIGDERRGGGSSQRGRRRLLHPRHLPDGASGEQQGGGGACGTTSMGRVV